MASGWLSMGSPRRCLAGDWTGIVPRAVYRPSGRVGRPGMRRGGSGFIDASIPQTGYNTCNSGGGDRGRKPQNLGSDVAPLPSGGSGLPELEQGEGQGVAAVWEGTQGEGDRVKEGRGMRLLAIVVVCLVLCVHSNVVAQDLCNDARFYFSKVPSLSPFSFNRLVIEWGDNKTAWVINLEPDGAKSSFQTTKGKDGSYHGARPLAEIIPKNGWNRGNVVEFIGKGTE